MSDTPPAAPHEESTERLPAHGQPEPAGAPPPQPRPWLPTPGQRLVERYTVLQILGEGGMGVVVAAYDERLDRRVALKLLRQQLSGSGELQARLVREAQAMARLSHPHVVAVYDSGRLEEGTFFIAMEYVEGKTLKEWCQQQARSWREVLRAYLEAGRGLAAAHAAGLIHRDFKPANVLVGHDGRVRVTDFGVARAESSHTAHTPVSLTPVSLTLSAWETPLTLPGSIMGTPRYLAPELLQGKPADARSDLFAFCVALYEALYGQPPFTGDTVASRLRAQKEGRLTAPVGKTEVPAWVGRVLAQGLSSEPALRPGSMQALIARLEDDPEVKRRQRLRVGALAGGALALAALAAWGWVRGQGPGCGAMERRLAGVWDKPVREQVHGALAGTGLSYAADTAQRVEAALEDYARAWVKMSQQVCEAAGSRPQQVRGLGALREACLERRLSQMRALTELLARSVDKELAAKAVQAVQALPPLEYCADERALTAAVPPPEEPALRARVEQLQQQVDRLEALYQAGRYAQGLAQADELLKQVEGVDFAPLRARAFYQVALLQDGAGEYKSAEARLRRAIPLAASGGDVQVLAKAWNLLLLVIGERQSRHQEALGLELTLEAAVQQARDDGVRATAHNTLGSVLRVAGKYEQALARYERALALREKALGPEHPDTAATLNNLGAVLRTMGRHEEALAHYERALALREKALGPEHPHVAASLNNLGNLLKLLDRYEEALARLQRALALMEKALGPEHPYVAASLNNLGNVLKDLGRYEEAQAHYLRALAMREKALGPEHPEVATTLNSLGRLLQLMGRYEEARARLEHALVLREKALGPEHSEVAITLTNLGDLLQLMGKHEEARARLERALALMEKALGPEHPALVDPLQVLAELHLAQRHPGKALPVLERALTLTPATEKAQVQLTLARALWDSGGDKRRAVVLATQAHAYWQAHKHPQQAQASQWLASHSPLP